MKQLEEYVSAHGLRVDIPHEVTEQLGWPEGQQVAVRVVDGGILIAAVPSETDRIRRLALQYLLRKVGDATSLGDPVWRENRWRVPVFLAYADCRVGELVFSESGELLERESSSVEAMHRAADAA